MRETFTAVRFIAEHSQLSLPKIYNLPFPKPEYLPDGWDAAAAEVAERAYEARKAAEAEFDDKKESGELPPDAEMPPPPPLSPEDMAAAKHTCPWTPFNICAGVALQRTFVVECSSEPDTHQAGLLILRDAIDGVIPLNFLPPGHFSNQMKEGKLVETPVDTPLNAYKPRKVKKEDGVPDDFE